MLLNTLGFVVESTNDEKLNLIFASDPINWKEITTNGKIRQNKWLLKVLSVALISTFFFGGCASEHSGGQEKITQKDKLTDTKKPVHKEIGEASWYGPGFQGQETANGDTFDQKEMTAAHPSLPMGTKASVTNLENGKKVEVTINDRGPYADNRVIDLSRGAAKKLGMEGDGTAKVKIETKTVKKKKNPSAKLSRKAKMKPRRIHTLK
jgi:rare lipoprotein A (peptidoglycan hydrolase)